MTTNDIINKQLEEIAELEKRLRDTEESLIAAMDQVTELEGENSKRQKTIADLAYYFDEKNNFAIEKQVSAARLYGEKLKDAGFSGVDSCTDEVIKQLREGAC